jgi:hypothetical protein
MVFVKRAVNGCHPLKFINLAALLNVQTHCVFCIKLALKTGALLENFEVWVSVISSYRPHGILAPFLVGPSPQYDKKSISHP